jgi:Fic family protein
MSLPAEYITKREIENGFRQFDLAVDIVRYYLDPERPFSLRPGLILDLQKQAVEGIEAAPGELRTTAVHISRSKHTPPAPHLVSTLVTEFCDYINDNWHERTAFHLSAYAMWRINWIHPFSDGNGRTARTVSYTLLCIKLGYELPGSPTIIEQIEEDKSHYLEALEAGDAAERSGSVDVSEMENMIRSMLAKQLLGVIEAAGGVGFAKAEARFSSRS